MIPLIVLFCMLIASSSVTGCSRTARPIPTPTRPPKHAEPYYFGTQVLSCVMGKTILKNGKMASNVESRSVYDAEERFTLSIVHRLIKYNGVVFEWGQRGFSLHVLGPLSRKCRVTWERRPAGYSTKTDAEAASFGISYDKKADYNVATNNCHMFANALSRFLTAI